MSIVIGRGKKEHWSGLLPFGNRLNAQQERINQSRHDCYQTVVVPMQKTNQPYKEKGEKPPFILKASVPQQGY